MSLTEAPFTPSPERAHEFGARQFLRDRIAQRGQKEPLVHVESVTSGPDDALQVRCLAEKDAFDALTRAGVEVTGYTYTRPFERFTANLSVSEISAVTASRSLETVGGASDESAEAFLPEVDTEATRG